MRMVEKSETLVFLQHEEQPERLGVASAELSQNSGEGVEAASDELDMNILELKQDHQSLV